MKQISRKLSRKILFQKIYAECFYHNNSELFQKSFIDGDIHVNEMDISYVNTMYDLIKLHESDCINIIERFAPKFEIEKMHLSYIIPLYIWICEIFYFPEEIPLKVSINEAIEIAKTFSDDSWKKIVNGVLNKLQENYNELKEKKPSLIKKNFSFFVWNN